MKRYRKTLQIRMVLLTALAVFAVCLGIYDAFLAPEGVRTNSVFGFQCGVTTAMGVWAAACLLRYGKALRNGETLQRQYVREHDERMQAIRAKAGMPLSLIFSLAMMAGGIVLGYVNETVFVALTAAAALQLLAAVVVKGVYMKIS